MTIVWPNWHLWVTAWLAGLNYAEYRLIKEEIGEDAGNREHNETVLKILMRLALVC